VQDNGKRKVVDSLEGEQSYRVKANSILMQAALAAKAKRKRKIQRGGDEERK